MMLSGIYHLCIIRKLAVNELLIYPILHLVRCGPPLGDCRQPDYGKVILPFTILRRVDCVLVATKPPVLAEFDVNTKVGLTPEQFLVRKEKHSFHNTSQLDLTTILGDKDHIRQNLYAYIQAFSPATRNIFECFDF